MCMDTSTPQLHDLDIQLCSPGAGAGAHGIRSNKAGAGDLSSPSTLSARPRLFSNPQHFIPADKTHGGEEISHVEGSQTISSNEDRVNIVEQNQAKTKATCQTPMSKLATPLLQSIPKS